MHGPANVKWRRNWECLCFVCRCDIACWKGRDMCHRGEGRHNLIVCNNLHFFLVITTYNPTFLWQQETPQTSVITVTGFTEAIRQFVLLYQYTCEGILMVVATATETCHDTHIVPCTAACKRSLELRGSRILRRNLSEHFSPTKSSTFRCWRTLASLDVKAPSGEGGNV